MKTLEEVAGHASDHILRTGNYKKGYCLIITHRLVIDDSWHDRQVYGIEYREKDGDHQVLASVSGYFQLDNALTGFVVELEKIQDQTAAGEPLNHGI